MKPLIILLALLPTTLYAELTEVIHILNYRYIPIVDYAYDMPWPYTIETLSLPADSETFSKYVDFLKDVDAVQKQQKRLLRDLIKKRKLKAVYIEGLTEKNYKDALNSIEATKEREKKEKKLNPTDQYFEALDKTDLLQLGAAGQLVVKGELKTVLPAEDSTAFKAANPIQPDGKIVFNKKTNEAREDAIVRNLLKGNGVVVIVLGGDHDLSDNLKRLSKNVKYKRVAVPKYTEVMKDQP